MDEWKLGVWFGLNSLKIQYFMQSRWNSNPLCMEMENGAMRRWHGYLSGTRCKLFLYGPADVTATTLSFASLKSRTLMVPAYPGCPEKEARLWYSRICAENQLTNLKRRPLNGYLCMQISLMFRNYCEWAAYFTAVVMWRVIVLLVCE